LLTDGIFPYVIGGMQKHSYYLCKFLAQKGVQIDLYHTNAWLRKPQYDIEKLEFFTEEEKENINSIVIPFPESHKFPGHYLWRSYKYSELIFKELSKRKKVDFIYTKGLTPWKLLREKSKSNFPPISNKSHGYEFFQIAPSYYIKLVHLFLRPAFKYITTNSDFIFSYGGNITQIIQNMEVPRRKILEIPTGIDKLWLREKKWSFSKLRKFVFIGRYERRKGIEELTEILRENKAFKEKAEFHFIGAIDKNKQVERSHIIYHGLITDTAKLKLVIQEADCLICPSYSEGMPNVILEGMASGCAIIATDVGAIPQQVSEDNGWLIPANDKVALYKAIKEAIDLEEKDLVKKRQNSIQKIKNQFLWEKIANQTINEIKKIVKIES